MDALCCFDLGRELLTRRPRLKAEIESIHTAGLPMRLSGMSEAGWPLASSNPCTHRGLSQTLKSNRTLRLRARFDFITVSCTALPTASWSGRETSV